MISPVNGCMSNAVKQELVEQRRIKKKIVIFSVISIFGLLLLVVSALLFAIFPGIITLILILLVFVGIVLFTCFFGLLINSRIALEQSENRSRVLAQYSDIRKTASANIARFENKLSKLIARFRKERSVSLPMNFCDKYYRSFDSMKRTLSLKTIDLNPENLHRYVVLSKDISLGVQDLERSFEEEMRKLRILLEEIFRNDCVLTFSMNRLYRSLRIKCIPIELFNTSLNFFEKIKENFLNIQAHILSRAELSDEGIRDYLKAIAELQEEIEAHAVAVITKMLRLENILQNRTLKGVLTEVQSWLEAILKEKNELMTLVDFYQSKILNIKTHSDAIGSSIHSQLLYLNNLLQDQKKSINYVDIYNIICNSELHRQIESELMVCTIMKFKKQSELRVVETCLDYIERAAGLSPEELVVFWQKNEEESAKDQVFVIKESWMIYELGLNFISSYSKYVSGDQGSMKDSSDGVLGSLITEGRLLCSYLGIEEFDFSVDKKSLILLMYRKIFNKLNEIGNRFYRSDKILLGIKDISTSVLNIVSLPMNSKETEEQYHARISEELNKYYFEIRTVFLKQLEDLRTEIFNSCKKEVVLLDCRRSVDAIMNFLERTYQQPEKITIPDAESNPARIVTETDFVFNMSTRLSYLESLHMRNLILLDNLRYITVRRIEQIENNLIMIYHQNHPRRFKGLLDAALFVLQEVLVGEDSDADQQLMLSEIEEMSEEVVLIDTQYQEICCSLNEFKKWLVDWRISNL